MPFSQNICNSQHARKVDKDLPCEASAMQHHALGGLVDTEFIINEPEEPNGEIALYDHASSCKLYGMKPGS